MTILLFALDFIKERVGISKLGNKETSLNFDDENLTTPEEILQTRMEECHLKRKGDVNPFVDKINTELSETDQIYLNDKE